MTPIQGHICCTVAWYNGRLVDLAVIHEPQEYVRVLDRLIHELQAAKAQLQPPRVIVDPADDDEL